MPVETIITWESTRRETVELFGGQAPRPGDEATIIDRFEESPHGVLRAIADVKTAFDAGTVRFPWSVVAARLSASTAPLRNVTVDIGRSRESEVRLVEAFIRNAGCHIASESELVDEVFGDRGRLHRWSDDQALVERLVAFWRRHRPAGERVEAAELERAELWLKRRAATSRRPAIRPASAESLELVATGGTR
jgi:hypothetical protein